MYNVVGCIERCAAPGSCALMNGRRSSIRQSLPECRGPGPILEQKANSREAQGCVARAAPFDMLPTIARGFVVVGSGESGSPSAGLPSLKLGFSARLFKLTESVRVCMRMFDPAKGTMASRII
jgi:hypothetical protein